MTATITSIKPMPSKYGGTCYLVTFSNANRNSYHTWLSPDNHNFKNWDLVLKSGEGTIVGNLKVKEYNLINADSLPEVIHK